MEPHIYKLNETVNEFLEKFIKSDLKFLSFSEIYKLSLDWLKAYPNNELAAVYAFFDLENRLQYIGSTTVSIGARFKEYFKKDKTDRNKCIKLEKFNVVESISTLGLIEDNKFLAPAIESYLIYKLNPPINKKLKNL
ncbi:MAG: GIY-YIG nuclease family protein [Ignavibacteria bacterium]|nr:GIY-YIG nuclease family protein [Ignavibacteria bacterium]